MNVEIGMEAAQFPGKEYINGIFVAVRAFKETYGLFLILKPFIRNTC